ncbi:MAG: PAS domain S-box protein [Chitinophagaceae bacterium]|nr:MAG: PAS domain S-box protein [Chitinophagaceae bacterium]
MTNPLAAALSPYESAQQRIVHLYLHPTLLSLEGDWRWEARSEAVYGSDVIAPFPAGFEGTRGILHPDDVPALRAALAGEGPFDLSFRLISTHGAVLPLQGHTVRAVPSDPLLTPASPEAEQARRSEARDADRTAGRLRQRAQAADLAEKASGSASWYHNTSTHETWYSDNVFRLHGLQPQTLNAHLLTFTGYIHPADAAVVEDCFDRAYHRRLPLDITYRIVRPGGQERTLRLCTAWQFDESGAEVLYALLQDLSAQTALEERVSQLTDRLQTRQETLRTGERFGGLGSFQLNLHTGKWSFSDHYHRLLGLQPRTVERDAALLLQFAHPDDRELLREAFDKMREEHECPELEYRVLRNDGQTRHFQLRMRTLLLPSGELLLTGIVRDISLQRALERREARTRESAAQREALFRVAERFGALCTWTWDLQKNKIEWSSGFYELLGYKPNFLELSQKLLASFLHPDDRKKFNDAVDTVQQTRAESEIRLRLLVKERTRYLNVHLQVLTTEGSELFVAVFRDETDLHQQRQAVTTGERLLTVVSNYLSDRLLVTDETHTIIRVNDAAQKWLQGRGQPSVGQNLFEALPRLKAPGFVERMNAALRGEGATLPSLLSGEARESYQLLPVTDESGTVSAVLHLLRAGAPPLESVGRQLAASLADAVDERVIVLDRRLNYQVWNGACEKFYGIRREDVLGHNLLELAPGFLDDPGYIEFRRALRGETVLLHAPPAQKVQRTVASSPSPTSRAKCLRWYGWPARRLADFLFRSEQGLFVLLSDFVQVHRQLFQDRLRQTRLVAPDAVETPQHKGWIKSNDRFGLEVVLLVGRIEIKFVRNFLSVEL